MKHNYHQKWVDRKHNQATFEDVYYPIPELEHIFKHITINEMERIIFYMHIFDFTIKEIAQRLEIYDGKVRGLQLKILNRIQRFKGVAESLIMRRNNHDSLGVNREVWVWTPMHEGSEIYESEWRYFFMTEGAKKQKPIIFKTKEVSGGIIKKEKDNGKSKGGQKRVKGNTFYADITKRTR